MNNWKGILVIFFSFLFDLSFCNSDDGRNKNLSDKLYDNFYDSNEFVLPLSQSLLHNLLSNPLILVFLKTKNSEYSCGNINARVIISGSP